MKTINKHKANGALPVLTVFVMALKKTLKKVRNAASDSVVLLGMEIMSQCLERKIILMLKLLSSNYYTAMYIAITWGLR